MAQPQFELIPKSESQALIYKVDQNIWPVYHFHPEIDILYSLKDHSGEFISGDYTGRLEQGTLFMNGPNIPHALHSGVPDENDDSRPSLAVIQFSEDTLGQELLGKAEMQVVRKFLADARWGFHFFGDTAEQAGELILAMQEQSELERLIQLLRLLNLFANSTERIQMASPAYSPSLKGDTISRLDNVLQFLRANQAEPITLDQAAQVAGMSSKSFCRFFKHNTGKTLVQYLNEIRIGEACRLLGETELSVSEIALEAGFKNLSHFNRQFRVVKGQTPREYRALYSSFSGA